MDKNKDCRILYFSLDLADKKSIEEFSQKVRENCEKVDVLINNAGLFKAQRAITKDGFEMTMGVNHLGHFYLTYLLWNSLKCAKTPRVINVSSNAHAGMGLIKYNAAIDFLDINFNNNYKGDLAYTRSKIANILFTRSLQ
jgi:NAD(P)-dependent dehydrogenase (short-subunit alcohol dehydrogenase family)